MNGLGITDQDIVQTSAKAVAPPGNAISDGELLWQLAGRKGNYDLDLLRQELADVIDIPTNEEVENTV